MKTEKEIREKLFKIESILEYNNDNSLINYSAMKTLSIQRVTLNWVLGNIEDKNDLVKKKIGVKSNSILNQIIELLREYPEGLTKNQIADKLNNPTLYSNNSVFGNVLKYGVKSKYNPNQVSGRRRKIYYIPAEKENEQ
jgi:hypothetical protein